MYWSKKLAFLSLALTLITSIPSAMAGEVERRMYHDLDETVLGSREGWSFLGEGTNGNRIYASKVWILDNGVYAMLTKTKLTDGELLIDLYNVRPWECHDEQGDVQLERVIMRSNWGRRGSNAVSAANLNGERVADFIARRPCRFGAAKYEGY